MFIDTHAHLMDESFEGDLEQVKERAKEAGVSIVINVGCGCDFSQKAVEMVDVEKGFYATVALHPYDAEDFSEELMDEWEKVCRENVGVVAIGETGLDYVKSEVDREKQKESFRGHLQLARKVGLPVIVHNRGADSDCLEILREFDGSDGEARVEAVFHCFASDLSFAKKVWEAGYYTSFTGIITFKNAVELQEVVREAPMGLIMTETDCPYLAPGPYRGKRNEPAYVVEVVKKIVELKGLSEENVAAVVMDNAKRFFGLS
jgi:TatD DNase family protein